MYNKFRTS